MTKKSKSLTVKDVAEDVPASEYAEIALDSLIDDGLLKDLPVFSTGFAFFKLARRVKERRFKKRVEEFFKSAGNFTKEEMSAFAEKLEAEDNQEEFVSELIEMVERADSEFKAKVLGGVFRRLIKQELTIGQFKDQAVITNGMLLTDIITFMHGYHNHNILLDGLGDVLVMYRMAKREILLSSKKKTWAGLEEEQYIETKYSLSGIGKTYLITLHQVFREKIAPEHLVIK